jgi:gluconolactonase
MNPRPFLLIGLSSLPLNAGEPPPLPPVIAPGAKLERLSEGFQFTEGPTPDAAGNVYFTDQPNNRILKWSIDGKLSTFKEPAGRSNGMFFEPGGKLIACADENNELWAIDVKDASSTVRLKGFENKRLNGPNDVWVRPDGGLYFTDPFYKRPWWQHTAPEQSAQRVYFLAKNSGTALAVAEDLQQPNGITGTADGKTLFVADIRGKQTWKYAIQPDGTLTEKTLFCAMGSDGMTIDHAGNIYLTGPGVTVFDSSGKQSGVIPVPESWTANVCFGGKDFDTLFITAMDSLYAIKTTVKGVR